MDQSMRLNIRSKARSIMVGMLTGLASVLDFGQASAGDMHGIPEQEKASKWQFETEMSRHQQLLRILTEPGIRPMPFTTDGCSGGLSAGWSYMVRMIPGAEAIHGGLPPWESCCVAHDQLYHTGGAGQATALESYKARSDADLALQACVLATGAGRAQLLGREYGLSQAQVISLYESIAALMYRAVRIGGVPCSGLSWRWGYGWPPCD
jgi:hypothetical protein